MRTKFSRMPMPARRGILATVAAGSLLVGVAGCGGDGDDDGLPDDYKVVAGTQLCGGNALSTDASKSLKVITGMSEFEASAERYTVVNAAADLVEVFPTVTEDEDACRVYSAIGAPDFQLRITWRLGDAPTDEPAAPEFTVLKMGEETLAAADKAYVRFACRSDRLLDSTNVAHIDIGVRRWGTPVPPDDDQVEALKDAYATVAHSFSLAMAKELRCENNGGLPAKPVLEPV